MKKQKKMPTSKMNIQNVGGRWVLNGKKYEDLNLSEMFFFRNFFLDVKLHNLIKD